MKAIAHILYCLELDEVTHAEAARIEAIVTAVAAAPKRAEVAAKTVELIDPDGRHSRGVEVTLDRDPDGDYCRPVTVLGIIPEAAIRDYVAGHELASYIKGLLS